MPATLGALIAVTNSGILANEMVLKPAASISRCTSPTDQLQIGQAGTSTTTSTASSRKFRMIAGTVSLSKIMGCML